jgi:hypothetical protein
VFVDRKSSEDEEKKSLLLKYYTPGSCFFVSASSIENKREKRERKALLSLLVFFFTTYYLSVVPYGLAHRMRRRWRGLTVKRKGEGNGADGKGRWENECQPERLEGIGVINAAHRRKL